MNSTQYRIVANMLGNQLIIALTITELSTKQKGTPLVLPIGFVPQNQTAVLEHQAYNGSNSYKANSSVINSNELNIAVLEKKISQMETKYRQNWLHLIHRGQS